MRKSINWLQSWEVKEKSKINWGRKYKQAGEGRTGWSYLVWLGLATATTEQQHWLILASVSEICHDWLMVPLFINLQGSP